MPRFVSRKSVNGDGDEFLNIHFAKPDWAIHYSNSDWRTEKNRIEPILIDLFFPILLFNFFLFLEGCKGMMRDLIVFFEGIWNWCLFLALLSKYCC